MYVYNDKKTSSVPRASQQEALDSAQRVHIKDSRPEAIFQMKIKGMASVGLAHPVQKKLQEAIAPSSSAEGVSQLEAGLEEEELLQGKFKAAQMKEGGFASSGVPVHQLEAGFEEEEILQGKFGPPLQKKENNTGMPDNLKDGIENLSGMSMDHVKVHYNSERPAQLNALAFAQGSDIHVASGQEQHLPHEAWHVVQQMQGRVEPTIEVDGVPVNDNGDLEKEADHMGAQALNR